MTVPAGATVDLWQALATAQPPTRGAVLLVELGGARTWSEACAQPLSRCAGVALAELRSRAGDTMDTVVTCASCGALLDVTLDLGELADLPTPDTVGLGDHVVRAPTTGDLLLAREAEDPAAALRFLCAEAAAGSPPGALEAAVERLCGAAAVAIRTTCADCSASVNAEVDPVELLTARVTAEATDILRTVAEIAAVFGWPESEILALPPVRREHYLGLARSLRGRA